MQYHLFRRNATRVKIRRVAFNLTLVAALVVANMTLFVPTTTARHLEDYPTQDTTPAKLQPATNVTVLPVQADKSKLSGEIKAAAIGESDTSVFIIRLEGQSVATYDGGVGNLRATSPRVTGAEKLDMSSPDSVAYAEFLRQGRERLIQRMNQALGRDANVIYEYYATLNGLAVELTAKEAEVVSGLPNVAFVEPERVMELETFAGPDWMGAPGIWGGSLNDLSFAADLSGANEVPPVETAASGQASFSYNLDTNELSYAITVADIDNIVAAHIHVGEAGENGGVLHGLYDGTGTFDPDNPLVSSVTLTDEEEGLLWAAGMYVNIHTSDIPSGELRGQITSTGTFGEGIVVGIIDTGINPTNPSFADLGDDGYDHTNPLGAGNYLGVCNPGDESYDPTIPCNDKLIGIYAYPASDPSPVDTDGHGSHTAGTAAGNVVNADKAIVNAPNGKVVAKRISGVAPHANIIAYDGCTDDGGCPGAALAAARDQALIDGVDVINYSIGSSAPTGDPWTDAESLQWLALREAGVFVATSNGNSGNAPETTGSPADIPWITSVGASTHDVPYLNQLLDFTGGDTPPPPAITGRAVSVGYGPAPIVYADDFGDALCLNPFPAGTFPTGAIVVCDRGQIARVAKGVNAAAGGAGGLVLAEVTPSGFGALAADTHVIPAIHITVDDGNALKAWLASGSGHTARITDASLEQDPAFGDIMAKFSSRGPNDIHDDIIKPNVTATGVGIMAAYAVGVEFNIIQGTSMSSPHVAGAGALLKALHPDWTPGEIESALMSTAFTGVRDDDGASQAGYFAMGSGRVDLTAAAQAGLVLHETEENFMAANPADGGDMSTLNIASMGEGDCIVTCSWTRTVRNVLDTEMSWTAMSMGDEGVTVDVSPTNFTLAPGASQDIAITATLNDVAEGDWGFGKVVLTPGSEDVPATAMPVAAKSSFGELPTAVNVTTARNAGSQLVPDVESIAITDLTIDVHGLVRGDMTAERLISDPDNDSAYGEPYDPATNGTFFVTVDVPADTERFVAQIVESESADIDLFVGTGDTPEENNEVCRSTTGTSAEICIIEDPAPGTYFVLVQNWNQGNGGELPGELTKLVTAVVPNADLGNITVEGPSSADSGEPFDLRVFWNIPEMMAGEYWYGSFDMGPDAANPGLIGTVPVYVTRVADDVSKTADKTDVEPGDTVTYTITINPNITDEDLTYTMTDVIPDGMTYVEGSVTGGATVEGNVVSWTGVMAVPETKYNVTTSDTDELCRTPFAEDGLYDDLASFGIMPVSTIVGDSVAFNVTWRGGTANPIDFYGETKNPVTTITDDGFAFFDSSPGANPWINTPIPFADDPNDMMAPFWTDMEIFYQADEEGIRGVTLATAGPDLSIVEYDDMQLWSADGSNTERFDFQIIQQHTPSDAPGAYEVKFAYDNLSSIPEALTVGVENRSGSSGEQIIYNDGTAGTMHDKLVICFDLAGAAEPQVITYQVTVDEDASTSPLTNRVTHNTDAVGSMPAVASVDVNVALPAVNINEYLTLTNVATWISGGPQPPDAPVGVYTIRATFENNSTATLSDMYYQVAKLTGDNLLLNADGGPGGEGSILTITDPAALAPGESMTVVFEIGLASRSRFTFLVDAYGVVSGGVTAAVQTNATDGFSVTVTEDDLNDGQETWMYLPLLNK